MDNKRQIDWASNPSSFSLLVNAIEDRARAYPGSDRIARLKWGEFSDRGPESMAGVEVLRRALENDLVSGCLDVNALIGPLARSVMEVLLTSWESIRIDPVVPSQSITWPLPPDPWMEHPGSDPREALLARLVYLGANPWLLGTEVHKSSSLVEISLVGGYAGVVSQALNLPAAKHFNFPAKLSLAKGNLIQCATHLRYSFLVEQMLSMGVDQAGCLEHARDAKSVAVLLASGASLSEKTKEGNVVDAWVARLPSNTAQALLRECGTASAPYTLRPLVFGDKWRPLSDALAGFPAWVYERQSIDGISVSLPTAAALLFSPVEEGRQRVAAKLLERHLPADDQWVVQGILSEQCAVRMRARLLAIQAQPSTKSAVDARQRFLDVALGQKDELIEQDRQSLLEAAPALQGTLPGHILGLSALIHPMGTRRLTRYGHVPDISLHNLAILGKLVAGFEPSENRIHSTPDVIHKKDWDWMLMDSGALEHWLGDTFSKPGADRNQICGDALWLMQAVLASWAGPNSGVRAFDAPDWSATLFKLPIAWIKSGHTPNWTSDEAALFQASTNRLSGWLHDCVKDIIGDRFFAPFSALGLEEKTATATVVAVGAPRR
jgi:hypothetical protein